MGLPIVNAPQYGDDEVPVAPRPAVRARRGVARGGRSVWVQAILASCRAWFPCAVVRPHPQCTRRQHHRFPTTFRADPRQVQARSRLRRPLVRRCRRLKPVRHFHRRCAFLPHPDAPALPPRCSSSKLIRPSRTPNPTTPTPRPAYPTTRASRSRGRSRTPLTRISMPPKRGIRKRAPPASSSP